MPKIKQKTLSDKENLQSLINYPNLTEREQETIQDWLLTKIDESQISRNALDYFWFLNNKQIDRFNSTVNDSFSIAEYLEEYINWENWDENLDKLISDIEGAWEQEIALNLCYELTENIEQIQREIA